MTRSCLCRDTVARTVARVPLNCGAPTSPQISTVSPGCSPPRKINTGGRPTSLSLDTAHEYRGSLPTHGEIPHEYRGSITMSCTDEMTSREGFVPAGTLELVGY